jgi:hypothetical protein
MSATKYFSGSNSKGKKNAGADYSNDDVQVPNTFPEQAHFHKEYAVERDVEGEESNNDPSSDFVQGHTQVVRTLLQELKRWIRMSYSVEVMNR